jgi:hypothetical protein
MKRKLTRRQLAGAVLSSAAAQALPQTSATPDDELKAARDRLTATTGALAKQTVPMSTEPAFQFKAL